MKTQGWDQQLVGDFRVKSEGVRCHGHPLDTKCDSWMESQGKLGGGA